MSSKVQKFTNVALKAWHVTKEVWSFRIRCHNPVSAKHLEIIREQCQIMRLDVSYRPTCFEICRQIWRFEIKLALNMCKTMISRHGLIPCHRLARTASSRPWHIHFHLGKTIAANRGQGRWRQQFLLKAGEQEIMKLSLSRTLKCTGVDK